MVEYDRHRIFLPGEMELGQEEQLTLDCSAPPVPGRYTVELDMVAEGVAWFAQAGSPTVQLVLDVRAAN